MNSTQDHTIDIRQYVRMIWRRKGLIALCVVVSICGALVGLQFVPDLYVSKTTILIQDRQQLSREIERVMGGMARSTGTEREADKRRMAHMVGRVTSRPFLERVIRLLGMQTDPRVQELALAQRGDHPEVSIDELAMRMLVKNLQSRISFGSSGSGVFQISVADYGPENAQILARWISELFVDTSIQSSLDYLRATHDFGAEQLRIYEEALRRSEESLASYQEFAIQRSLDQVLVNAKNIAQAQALRQRVTDEVVTSRVRSKPLNEAALSVGVSAEENLLAADPAVVERIQALESVLRDEITSRLAEGVSDSWPPQGDYDVRRRELLVELEVRSQDLYPAVSADIRTTLVRQAFGLVVNDAQSDAAEMLSRAIAEFRGRARSQPNAEIELTRLEADVAENRRLLESFQAQLVASEVGEAMETTKLGLQMEILDPAQLPLEPSHPNKRRILLAALLLGPMIGVGLGIAAETMDTTLRSLDDFSRVFPEPLLGITPLVSRRIERSGKVRRHWIPATVSLVLLLTLGFFLAGAPLIDRLLSDARPVQISMEETP